MTDAPDPAGRPPAAAASVTAISRKDLEARIIANAWRDPAYQARLLADPKAVLQSELAAIDPSITLPASLNVSVHAEAADVYHLVEPRNPTEVAATGVGDDQLSGVAPQTVAVLIGTTTNSVAIDGYFVVGPVALADGVQISSATYSAVANVTYVAGTTSQIAAVVAATAAATTTIV